MALRITKTGLEAIDVEDAAVVAPKETSVRPAPAQGKVETPAPKAVIARKRISAATQRSARKKHHPGKAKTKAGSRRDSRPGSKQARVLAMLGRPEGATIASIMRGVPVGNLRSEILVVQSAQNWHRQRVQRGQVW